MTQSLRPTSLAEQMDAMLADLEGPPRALIGPSTGFGQLDEITQGLQGVIALAGMPGAGKTAFALQMSRSLLLKATPVLFVSLELSTRDLFARLLSQESKLPWRDIIRRRMDDAARRNVWAASDRVRRYADKLFVIDDTPGLSLETLRRQGEEIKARTGCESILVIVDHLQIFPSDGAARNQKDLLDRLVSEFKALSRTLSSPVLLISQMNRAGYKSDGLDAFMGSAGIEYLAHLALFLSSVELEKRTKKDSDDTALSIEADTKPVRLSVAKNRSGPAGRTVDFDFDGAISTFYER